MAKQQLFCPQGTDFSTSVMMSADDGTPINVAGYLFGGVIRKNIYSINASATLIITSPDAANGNVLITLDAANTANLPLATYNYTIEYKNTANINAVLLEGFFVVTPSVINEQPVP